MNTTHPSVKADSAEAQTPKGKEIFARERGGTLHSDFHLLPPIQSSKAQKDVIIVTLGSFISVIRNK